MPIVDYVFIDPSEINHEICVISDAEWNRRIEEEHRWESDGRIARREISVFDQMMEELSAEKQNRREKFMRTHYVRNDGKSTRKDKRKSYRKEMEYRMDPWAYRDGCVTVKQYRRKVAEETTDADFRAEMDQHADVMDQIHRLDAIAEYVNECAEPVNEWFCNSNISGWTYEDGTLCYGARDRINELRYYKEELNGYVEESARLRNDEQYLRRDIGIIPRMYLKLCAEEV